MKIEKYKLLIYGFVICAILSYIVYSFVLVNKSIEMFSFQSGKKVVFLHIPKCAGTSFRNTFSIDFRDHDNAFPREDEINIAIIRNPITRLQSIFSHLYMRTSKRTDKVCDLENFENLDDLARAYYDQNHKYHKKAKMLLTWDKNKLLNKQNICDDSCCIHWSPQHLFVEGHNSKVDYLLKFENLDEDIKKLQHMNLLKSNKKSKYHKVSEKKYKNLSKLTPICYKLINEVYKDDFKLWEMSGIE